MMGTRQLTSAGAARSTASLPRACYGGLFVLRFAGVTLRLSGLALQEAARAPLAMPQPLLPSKCCISSFSSVRLPCHCFEGEYDKKITFKSFSLAVYPAEKVFTWEEFKRKFRESNVPESIVELKRREFESLEQKDKAILTYVREFSRLSRYAVEEVNTEDKKKKRFLRGLSPQFKVQLRMMRATEFQELVDAAITLEDDFKLQEEKRKKAKFEPKRFVSNKPNTGLSQGGVHAEGLPQEDYRGGQLRRRKPWRKYRRELEEQEAFEKLNCTSLEEVVNSDQAVIGKANVVADALSRKSTGGVEQELSPELRKELSQAQIQLWEKEAHEGLSALQVADELNVNLKNEIMMGQLDDPFIVEEMRRIDEGRQSEFHRGESGSLWFQKRICVPDIAEIKEVILREAHQTPYSIHPGSTKMYMDLKELFWWNNMKREIAQYVAECHTCQRVKAEHQSPAGKLQPLPIPEWKWEDIGMDFITGLPMTNKKKDMIWVIVDRLTKSAHFLAVNQQDKGEKLIDLYIKEIVSKHGVPKKIVSDRGSVFTSAFWKQLHEALGSKLDYSTAYHPQIGGQTERTNQILEDILRACALDFGGSWEEHLPLAEFSYNNSYQSSIKMAPFEALYGRKCRSPICWYEAGASKEFNPDYVKEKQQIIDIIRDRLKIAQSRQKSYADQKRRTWEPQVGDMVYLKVSPMKGLQRFGVKGKLSPRYIGPFKILSQNRGLAFELELPGRLSQVHNIFHVSQLRKCLKTPDEPVSHDELELQPDLTYIEKPAKILEENWKQLRNRAIKYCKIQWKHHPEREATWEKEEDMRKTYPELFRYYNHNFGTKFSLRGKGCNVPGLEAIEG
ncbi:hypothetical protein QYE76_026238 [Lolium multiflorum]|uniref:Integrase catalytic domain-containing protein n=1 Tax=Lolium multiflorum TaxID=4521 RepID=A0AAD8VWN9_LOLMU|nr:hypothetical protein QYE76_026238 [Lolium multiflorum]